jgi:hypothetical protein
MRRITVAAGIAIAFGLAPGSASAAQDSETDLGTSTTGQRNRCVVDCSPHRASPMRSTSSSLEGQVEDAQGRDHGSGLRCGAPAAGRAARVIGRLKRGLPL